MSLRLLAHFGIFGLLALSLPAQRSAEALRKQLRAGDWESVVRALEEARPDGALELDALLVGVEAAIYGGDTRLGRRLADEAQARFPEAPEAKTWYAHALFAEAEARLAEGLPSPFISANFSDAAQYYREARSAGGDVYTNALCEAEAHDRLGHLDRALEAIEYARNARPTDAVAATYRARLLLRASRPTEAIATLADFSTDTVELSRALLQAHLEASDAVTCRRVFIELAQRHRNDQELYRSFFTRYQIVGGVATNEPLEPQIDVRAGSTAWLRQTFAELARRDEGERLAHWYLGWIDQSAGRWSDALASFVRYRDAAPRDGGGHFHVAQVLRLAGRLDEAREALLSSVAAGGVDSSALAVEVGRLVREFASAALYERAMALQRVAVSLTDDISYVRDLGLLQVAGGRSEDAQLTFQRLLEREDLGITMRASIENDLGLLYVGTGRVVEAEATFRRALEVLPSAGDARENLGVLLLGLGRKDEARDLLTEVLRQDPTRTRARYHRLRIEHAALIEGRGR